MPLQSPILQAEDVFCVEKDCWTATIMSSYKHFGHLKGRWCWWRSQRNLRLIWVRRSIFKTGDKCWRQTVICNSSCNEFPQELWIKTNQSYISNTGIKLRRNHPTILITLGASGVSKQRSSRSSNSCWNPANRLVVYSTFNKDEIEQKLSFNKNYRWNNTFCNVMLAEMFAIKVWDQNWCHFSLSCLQQRQTFRISSPLLVSHTLQFV